ncbi:MAG: DUF615 domain-containing protein [Pseudomonadota bacterium]|nr:DUF615 domain-containing protein [Pseudomonadota bacterium]
MEPQQDHDDTDDAFDGPSKSQRKRDMHALQDLGEALAALSRERLRSLDLPDGLRDALLQVRSLRTHGAIRRQLQYVGKLMRDVDPAPLQARLDAWNGVSREAVARQHEAENWRERLLADDAAFAHLLEAYPGLDIPELRTLIRNARREREESKAPRNFRELYRALLALIEGGGADTDAAPPA